MMNQRTITVQPNNALHLQPVKAGFLFGANDRYWPLAACHFREISGD